jgi:hypothetical protein
MSAWLHWSDPFVWFFIAAIVVLAAWSINGRQK